jgi:transcriptional regulator with GAF, ATPase, and Fis domain
MGSPSKFEISGDVSVLPGGTGRRYEAVLRLSEALSQCREPEDLTKILADQLREFLEFLQFYIIVYKENSIEVEWAVVGREKSLMAGYADVPVEQRPSWQAYTSQEPFHIQDWNTDERVPTRLKEGIAAQGLDVGPLAFVPLTTPHRRLGALGMSGPPGAAYTSDDIGFLRLKCVIPLVNQGRAVGVLAIARTTDNLFTPEEVEFLKDASGQIAIAIENCLAYREVSELKERLAQEKLYLEQEIRGNMDFGQIVGNSPALKRVLQLVETVASSDSTVLVLGETGTGKELIARAIHDSSRRKDRTFVKVNCAAIPTGLLESELFGHEKGAFAGAIIQKIGRLELADQGTLFLDEVGDIPLEIQPKLLRALQEREFERLGSSRTRKVNVRLIAATNRDLEKMVAAHEFRSDLYYRLHVFPIGIPPLRERKEDIPLLVSYFVEKFAKQMSKKIDSIPAAVMKGLKTWEWPGNIRELENLIERAVILTRGRSLEAPLSELRKVKVDDGERAPADQENIARIVKETIKALHASSATANPDIRLQILKYGRDRLKGVY